MLTEQMATTCGAADDAWPPRQGLGCLQMMTSMPASHPRRTSRCPLQAVDCSNSGDSGRGTLPCRAWKGHDDTTDAPPHADAGGSFKYKRVMLKLSGEALEGDMEFGIDPAVLRTVAQEVASISRHGIEIAIVVGGGNFFRGVNRWDGLERTTADYVAC